MTGKEKFFNIYFKWFVLIVGLPLIVYGAWFQSVGFTYASLILTIICLIGGIVGGFFYVKKFETQLEHPSVNANMKKKNCYKMVQGLTIGVWAALLLLYFAVHIIMYYLGILVPAFFWSSLVFFTFFESKKVAAEGK